MDATARETFLLAAIAYAEALAEVARSEERGDVRATRAALLDHADAGTLHVDGRQVGQGRVERTQPMAFSADETCDVGDDTGSPVSPDYGPQGNAFTGTVNWVQIDVGKDDHDHLIAPEERFNLAMARQ